VLTVENLKTEKNIKKIKIAEEAETEYEIE